MVRPSTKKGTEISKSGTLLFITIFGPNFLKFLLFLRLICVTYRIPVIFTLFSGKALFDIEQLLAFKSDEEQLINTKKASIVEPKSPKSDDQTWKFFDPLASPTEDEELRRLEAVLDAKAKKAQKGLILESRPDIIASTERPSERRSRAAPKGMN